ncbi:MAG TPA: SusC/RagA family TonB-linked outer membrane protein [Longimicrobiales bacterium]|nr:SusC/RagA family TonB-linked outer membrane protein [Longimicrobiales bacterium]
MRKAVITALSCAFVLLCAASAVNAQTGRVTGQVTDRNTQQPLVGVQVYLEGTSHGTITGDGGRYILQNVPPGVYTVSAQSIGYSNGRRENVRITADAPTVIDFAMATQALRLTEVVVTGTVDPTSGVRVPFTVGKVTAADLPIPAVNAEASIRGRVAGARVVKGSGQPGTGVSVVLRGATSITKSNAPLYVVDGVILSASMVDVDASDIESVEVVKGAAAASLYGSRASAGVVQIRTNRGRDAAEGQTRITLRSEYGQSELPDHPVRLTTAHHFLMDAQGNYLDRNGQVVDRGNRTMSANMWERIQDRNYPSGVTLYNHLETFFDPGSSQRHSVSIAQNTRSTNFMASFNQNDESGVVPGHEGFQQRSLRANLDHRLRQDVVFGLSSYYSRSVRDDFGGTNPFYDLMFFAPDVNLLENNADGEPYNIRPDPLQLQANPLYSVHFADYKQYRSRLMANTSVRYSPANWFNLETMLSFDRSDRNDHDYLPKGFKTINSPTGIEGLVRRDNNIDQAINGSLQAATLHSFGDLTMRMRTQGSYERAQSEFVRGQGDQLVVQDVERVDVGAVRSGSSSQTDVRSLGLLGMLALDYAGKYIAEGMVRRDGSSLFGPDNRWHNYYRGSAAYLLSEEEWWPVDALNVFKLRYSIGTAGGRPEFADQYEVWSVSGGTVSKSVLGNRNLKPEHQMEQEFGVDMILNDRYQLTLTRALSTVEDQLLQIPLPAVFGYSVQWQNAGTVESNTWEGELQAQLLQRGDFTWSVSAVADRTRSEVTEFDRACYSTGPNSAFWLCQGETLGTMRGYAFMRGLDELPAAARDRASEFQVNDEGLLVWVGPGNSYSEGATKQLWGSTVTMPGFTQALKWGMPVFAVDSAGSRASVKIGDSNPRFNWGLSNNVSWKGLSLYTLFESQVGGDIYSNTRQWAYRDMTHGDYDQRDKAEGDKKPVDYYQHVYNVNATTGYFVEEGGYVKLRELSLRYSIGRNVLERLFGGAGIERAGIQLIGRNLLTWTNYKGGFDPEVGSGDATRLRFDGFGYPNFRTITGAVEIVF